MQTMKEAYKAKARASMPALVSFGAETISYRLPPRANSIQAFARSGASARNV
jgi:hypothetical protein